MYRLCYGHRRVSRSPRSLPFLFSTASSKTPTKSPHNLPNSLRVQTPPPPILPNRTPSTASYLLSRNSTVALSATAVVASVVLLSSSIPYSADHHPSPLVSVIESAVQKSSGSVNRILDHARHTGAAASVLWKSLRSILSSANHEVRYGFDLTVASLLADIAAANASRRAALVGAGGGAVVDWLLETVAVPREGCRTQGEAARALAYLIADPNLCEAVLGRPHAITNLLRFIFSSQPQRSKKHSRRSSFDVSDSLKGRSMLVAAIMDIVSVTSKCDSLDKVSFQPSLPGNAETRDIAAAIQVIGEGGMHLDESDEGEDDEDGGMKGIRIKIFKGNTVLGLSRTSGLMKLEASDDSEIASIRQTTKTHSLQNKLDSSLAQENLSSSVVPGLWDDLHCEHVAVPFAAWALANWAVASDANRSRIQELDEDGYAVMTALMAPERSVKWHGSLVARLLLEDQNLPLNDSVSDWSSSLLSTVTYASKTEDIPLAQAALSALLVSVERSPAAQKVVMEKGLHLMRDAAKRTTKYTLLQERLAKVLKFLCSGDMRLSLKESQKWSAILLPWIFGKDSSDTIRSSATNILSSIFEDYGASSMPMSQGWLAIMLTEILSLSKSSSIKGLSLPQTDKVKTQIGQANILSAEQIANQLASAVVSLAGNQVETETNSGDTFPLADLLSLEPFAGPYKKLKKDNIPKFHAVESAMATLKGIKALTEVCAEDTFSQDKIVDFGVLCLLRRFLLCDDYEKLAAAEACDASRALEAQEGASNDPGKSSTSNVNEPSSVKVTPTAHIRRHAARLLTILSQLPKVQKAIVADESWCEWLEGCANGKIPGCNDLKIQSYARATLLNVFCNQQIGIYSEGSNVPGDGGTAHSNSVCPRYGDMIYLINPELPHWNCPEKNDQNTIQGVKPSPTESSSIGTGDETSISGNLVDKYNRVSKSDVPLDVVFVHGLRGGPYKTWRISEDKYSTKSGLIEKIDEEAGKQGTFWPGGWLSTDFPHARMFTIRYKSSLTQWSGASLPLQEVSSMLLEKLLAAGIGDRPVVFVTHSMGGLVVKQMLHKAKEQNIDNLVNNTVGVAFYSCPHFGSRLADMPWKMGLVLRPAPTIGELRSGSPRLIELNDFIRRRYKKGSLNVLSFCETQVTPIVEGYGGWAFRMEIVPIESAYPGFGELVVLESSDHINSCKPLSRADLSYTEILEFLRKLKLQHT